ncbi:TetR/AcrR family transcriptional regulator [Nocardioides sambongensis]|uniref:TetR/AcrR family transcriptional regulator n=1 Tax=Nocardioides sambongensis TaxID=2589074 RepID=UPI0015E842C9|nr:TetR family transcriptional regulator [Nocardioides sambongensis]
MSHPTVPLDESHLRPAGRATRTAIEEAGRHLFGSRTYEEVSVRMIAAEAGVDPAMVIRHFGSKEALYLRSIDPSLGVGEVIEGPVETLGRRLVAYFLDQRNSAIGKRHASLVQASYRRQVRAELNRHTRVRFVDAIAPRLEGDDAELRVALAVAQLGGFLTMLFVQQDPLVTEADPDLVTVLYGDGLQRLLTP